MKPYPVDQSIAPKIREWLATRGGVNVWRNQDLGSSTVGNLAFTPVHDAEGNRQAGSPHWRYGHEPEAVVTEASGFVVQTYIPAGIVKARTRGYGRMGVHLADKARLDSALDKAGPGATWGWDAEAWQYGSAWGRITVYKYMGESPL